jgi:hypothetical protein
MVFLGYLKIMNHSLRNATAPSAQLILACRLKKNGHTQPCWVTNLGATMPRAITRFIQTNKWCGTFQAVNQPSVTIY